MRPEDSFFDEMNSIKEFQGLTLLTGQAFSKAVREWSESTVQKLRSLGESYLSLSDETSIFEYHRLLKSVAGMLGGV